MKKNSLENYKRWICKDGHETWSPFWLFVDQVIKANPDSLHYFYRTESGTTPICPRCGEAMHPVGEKPGMLERTIKDGRT